MLWNQDFETGLPELDAQHHRVFERIQQLSALSSHADRPKIHSLLEDIERLAQRHFASEERLMADVGYPEASRHAQEHRQLLREMEGYRENEVFSGRQLTLVLTNWLVSHTMMQDRRLAIFVLEQEARALGLSITELIESSEPVTDPRVSGVPDRIVAELSPRDSLPSGVSDSGFYPSYDWQLKSS